VGHDPDRGSCLLSETASMQRVSTAEAMGLEPATSGVTGRVGHDDVRRRTTLNGLVCRHFSFACCATSHGEPSVHPTFGPLVDHEILSSRTTRRGGGAFMGGVGLTRGRNGLARAASASADHGRRARLCVTEAVIRAADAGAKVRPGAHRRVLPAKGAAHGTIVSSLPQGLAQSHNRS
jgi:hypothetical protein